MKYLGKIQLRLKEAFRSLKMGRRIAIIFVLSVSLPIQSAPAYLDASCLPLIGKWVNLVNRWIMEKEAKLNKWIDKQISVLNFDWGNERFGIQGAGTLGFLRVPEWSCSNPYALSTSGTAPLGLTPSYLIVSRLMGTALPTVELSASAYQGRDSWGDLQDSSWPDGIRLQLKVFGLVVDFKERRGPDITAPLASSLIQSVQNGAAQDPAVRAAQEAAFKQQSQMMILNANLNHPQRQKWSDIKSPPSDQKKSTLGNKTKERTGARINPANMRRSLSDYNKGKTPTIQIYPWLTVVYDAWVHVGIEAVVSYELGSDELGLSFIPKKSYSFSQYVMTKNPANDNGKICEDTRTGTTSNVTTNQPNDKTRCIKNTSGNTEKDKSFYAKLKEKTASYPITGTLSLPWQKMKDKAKEKKIDDTKSDAYVTYNALAEQYPELLDPNVPESRKKEILDEASLQELMRPAETTDKLQAIRDLAEGSTSASADLARQAESARMALKNGVASVTGSVGIVVSGYARMGAKAILKVGLDYANIWAGVEGQLNAIDIKYGLATVFNNRKPTILFPVHLERIAMDGFLNLIWGVQLGIPPAAIIYSDKHTLIKGEGEAVIKDWIAGGYDLKAEEHNRDPLFWCKGFKGERAGEDPRCYESEGNEQDMEPLIAAWEEVKGKFLNENYVHNDHKCFMKLGGKVVLSHPTEAGYCGYYQVLPMNSNYVLSSQLSLPSIGITTDQTVPTLVKEYADHPESFLTFLRDYNNRPLVLLRGIGEGWTDEQVYRHNASAPVPALVPSTTDSSILVAPDYPTTEPASSMSMNQMVFTITRFNQKAVRTQDSDPASADGTGDYIFGRDIADAYIKMDWAGGDYSGKKIYVGDLISLSDTQLIAMASDFKLGRCMTGVDYKTIFVAGKPFPLDGPDANGTVEENMKNDEDPCWGGDSGSKLSFAGCTLRRALYEGECFPKDRVKDLVKLANVTDFEIGEMFWGTDGNGANKKISGGYSKIVNTPYLFVNPITMVSDPSGTDATIDTAFYDNAWTLHNGYEVFRDQLLPKILGAAGANAVAGQTVLADLIEHLSGPVQPDPAGPHADPNYFKTAKNFPIIFNHIADLFWSNYKLRLIVRGANIEPVNPSGTPPFAYHPRGIIGQYGTTSCEHCFVYNGPNFCPGESGSNLFNCNYNWHGEAGLGNAPLGFYLSIIINTYNTIKKTHLLFGSLSNGYQQFLGIGNRNGAVSALTPMQTYGSLETSDQPGSFIHLNGTAPYLGPENISSGFTTHYNAGVDHEPVNLGATTFRFHPLYRQWGSGDDYLSISGTASAAYNWNNVYGAPLLLNPNDPKHFMNYGNAENNFWLNDGRVTKSARWAKSIKKCVALGACTFEDTPLAILANAGEGIRETPGSCTIQIKDDGGSSSPVSVTGPQGVTSLSACMSASAKSGETGISSIESMCTALASYMDPSPTKSYEIKVTFSTQGMGMFDDMSDALWLNDSLSSSTNNPNSKLTESQVLGRCFGAGTQSGTKLFVGQTSGTPAVTPSPFACNLIGNKPGTSTNPKVFRTMNVDEIYLNQIPHSSDPEYTSKSRTACFATLGVPQNILTETDAAKKKVMMDSLCSLTSPAQLTALFNDRIPDLTIGTDTDVKEISLDMSVTRTPYNETIGNCKISKTVAEWKKILLAEKCELVLTPLGGNNLGVQRVWLPAATNEASCSAKLANYVGPSSTECKSPVLSLVDYAPFSTRGGARVTGAYGAMKLPTATGEAFCNGAYNPNPAGGVFGPEWKLISPNRSKCLVNGKFSFTARNGQAWVSTSSVYPSLNLYSKTRTDVDFLNITDAQCRQEWADYLAYMSQIFGTTGTPTNGNLCKFTIPDITPKMSIIHSTSNFSSPYLFSAYSSTGVTPALAVYETSVATPTLPDLKKPFSISYSYSQAPVPIGTPLTKCDYWFDPSIDTVTTGTQALKIITDEEKKVKNLSASDGGNDLSSNCIPLPPVSTLSPALNVDPTLGTIDTERRCVRPKPGALLVLGSGGNLLGIEPQSKLPLLLTAQKPVCSNGLYTNRMINEKDGSFPVFLATVKEKAPSSNEIKFEAADGSTPADPIVEYSVQQLSATEINLGLRLPISTDTPSYSCLPSDCTLAAEFGTTSKPLELSWLKKFLHSTSSADKCHALHENAVEDTCMELGYDETIPDNSPVKLVSYYGTQKKTVGTCAPKAELRVCELGSQPRYSSLLSPVMDPLTTFKVTEKKVFNKPVSNGETLPPPLSPSEMGTLDNCRAFAMSKLPVCGKQPQDNNQTRDISEPYKIRLKYGNVTEDFKNCHAAPSLDTITVPKQRVDSQGVTRTVNTPAVQIGYPGDYILQLGATETPISYETEISRGTACTNFTASPTIVADNSGKAVFSTENLAGGPYCVRFRTKGGYGVSEWQTKTVDSMAECNAGVVTSIDSVEERIGVSGNHTFTESAAACLASPPKCLQAQQTGEIASNYDSDITMYWAGKALSPKLTCTAMDVGRSNTCFLKVEQDQLFGAYTFERKIPGSELPSNMIRSSALDRSLFFPKPDSLRHCKEWMEDFANLQQVCWMAEEAARSVGGDGTWDNNLDYIVKIEFGAIGDASTIPYASCLSAPRLNPRATGSKFVVMVGTSPLADFSAIQVRVLETGEKIEASAMLNENGGSFDVGKLFNPPLAPEKVVGIRAVQRTPEGLYSPWSDERFFHMDGTPYVPTEDGGNDGGGAGSGGVIDTDTKGGVVPSQTETVSNEVSTNGKTKTKILESVQEIDTAEESGVLNEQEEEEKSAEDSGDSSAWNGERADLVNCKAALHFSQKEMGQKFEIILISESNKLETQVAAKSSIILLEQLFSQKSAGPGAYELYVRRLGENAGYEEYKLDQEQFTDERCQKEFRAMGGK